MSEKVVKPRTLILGTLIFGAISFAFMLLLDTMVPRGAAQAVLPEISELASVEIGGTRFDAPTNWNAPTMLENGSIILSPDGSTSVQPNAGPFVLFIQNPLERFAADLNIRTDLTDPVAQLDAIVEALNRNGPRFKAAQPYTDAPHPAAFIKGYERGNELSIILMRTDDGRWLYVGLQARDAEFEYYDSRVFRPAIQSVRY
jgi:hypothetical protein